MRRTISLLCPLLLIIPACKPRQASQSATDHQSLHQITDVCALLSKQEIEAVQGSPITATKSSSESQEVFRLSQCYYSTAESNKSVSLALTQANPSYKGKRSPKDFWNETFGPYDQEKEADRISPTQSASEGGAKPDKEKEEKAAPPKASTVPKADKVDREAPVAPRRPVGTPHGSEALQRQLALPARNAANW